MSVTIAGFCGRHHNQDGCQPRRQTITKFDSPWAGCCSPRIVERFLRTPKHHHSSTRATRGKMKTSPSALLVLCLTLGYATAQTCYFPNGSEAPDDVPCSDDQHTNCCGKAGICLSNGFCLNALSQPYTISRGTCTDQNWGSNCTQRCIGRVSTPCSRVSRRS